MSESIDLTVKLYKHIAGIYNNTAGDLDYLICDNPSYYRQAEILETELFMLTYILLELRVKSEQYIKSDKDYNIFGKILGSLYDKYLGDCLEVDKELFFRTGEHLKAFITRMDDYRKLYSKKGPIELVQTFYNILFNEIKTLKIYNRSTTKIFNLQNVEIGRKELGLIIKLNTDVFSVANLFFKDGILQYIDNELKPTDEFNKLEEEIYNNIFK